MNGFDLEGGRDFVPFDTYSFGIHDTGMQGLRATDRPDTRVNSPRLLPDLLESDLSEALRSGVSDAGLEALLTQNLQTTVPRVQTLQLADLSPMGPEDAYHFDPIPAEASPEHPGPSIDIQKNGDRVEKISIHCTCGEVIHLDCVY